MLREIARNVVIGFRVAVVGFSIAVILGAALLALKYAGPYVRTWDEVDFVLALQRYDLLAMQPHFPGYPYFILGGTIAHLWVADPVRAFVAFNVAATLGSVVPMALLVRRLTGEAGSAGAGRGLLFGALVLTSPYLWMMSARPMSECAGMAALWWFLWSARAAMERKGSWFWHMAALFGFGLTMGIRLSFFPFGLLVLPLLADRFRQARSRGRRWAQLGCFLAAAALFQSIWIAGVVFSEGTPAGFWRLATAFVEGHFAEWGGSIAASPMPLGERTTQLIGINLARDVWLGGSPVLGLLWAVLLAAVVIVGLRRRRGPAEDAERRGTGNGEGGRREVGSGEAERGEGGRREVGSGEGERREVGSGKAERGEGGRREVGSGKAERREAGRTDAQRANRRFLLWLAVCIAAYTVWALLGQNIEKPRHIAPVVGPLLLFAYIAVVRAERSVGRRSGAAEGEPSVRRALPALLFPLLIAATIVGQFVHGTGLLMRQAGEEPAVYQLHRHLRGMDEPFALYTWEETRVLQYLQAEYEHRRIYTYEYFQVAAEASAGRRVLLTDHVLEGFKRQGHSVHSRVEQVAEFRSNALFDPVYSTIVLYEWVAAPKKSAE